MSNRWLDPTQFKTQDEFVKAYNEVHGRAQAYGELIDMLSGAEGKIEQLTKSLSTDKKSYGI